MERRMLDDLLVPLCRAKHVFLCLYLNCKKHLSRTGCFRTVTANSIVKLQVTILCFDIAFNIRSPSSQ